MNGLDVCRPSNRSFRRFVGPPKAPEELFYDTFLPYLMNTPAVVDVLYPKKPPASGVEAPETDFHSVPQVFGPWRSLTLLWKHLLRTVGSPEVFFGGFEGTVEGLVGLLIIYS